jgi:hypothetical protein
MMASKRTIAGMLAMGSALALAPAAHAQEVAESAPPEDAPTPAPPPRPKPAPEETHAYVELRPGLGTYADAASGYGPAFGAAFGIAWGWLDLGLAANVASLPHDATDTRTTILGVGPEIATRTWLGGPATLRLAVDPQYRSMRAASASTGTIGADVLAQFLFTIDERTVPAWRVGVGVRGGRFWEMGSGDKAAYWTLGLDLVLRSWW